MTRDQWIILIVVSAAVIIVWLYDKIKNGKDD